MTQPSKLSETVSQVATKACTTLEGGALPVNLPALDAAKPPRASTPIDWRVMLERHNAQRDRIPAPLRETMGNMVKGELPWPLVIIGEAGAGKTLGALLFLEWWGRGGTYTTLPRFCHRLAEALMQRLYTSSGYQMQVDDVWEEWSRVPFAIMDEVGTRDRVSDHHFEALLEALNSREGRPTIFVSNSGRTQLSRVYDDRVASRLTGGTVVYVKGDQRRGKTIKEAE